MDNSFSSPSRFIVRTTSQTYKNVKPFLWRVLIICMGSFFMGYALAYFSGIGCKILNAQYTGRQGDNVYSVYQARITYFFLLGVIPLFACLGSLLSNVLNNYFSRRNSVCVTSIIGCLGTIVVMTGLIGMENVSQQSIGVLVAKPQIWIGRAIQGISVGIFSVLCPLFVKELVPIQLAVHLGVIHQLMFSVGVFAAKVLGQTSSLSGMPLWVLFGLPLPVFLAQIVMMKTSFKYETPKYWISVDEQQKAKSFFNHFYNQDTAEQIFLDLRAAYRLQTENTAFMDLDYNIVSIKRKALAIGVYIAILQQLSGISYITMFGVYPDRCQGAQKVSDTSFQVGWSLLQCISTFTLVITNSKSCPSKIKRFSQRRFLFQVGSVVSALSMLIVVCLLPPFDQTQKDILPIQIVITVFMVMYGWTLGPTTWIYLSEILQFKHMSIALFFNWLLNFLIVSFFPLIGGADAYNKQIIFYGLIILLPCLFLSIYLNHKYIVETKNRHKLDIIRDIDTKRLPFNLFN